MKKLSFLALFVAVTMAFSSCKKEEETTPSDGGSPGISQDQNAVGFYLSGNWCGPCGLYGKPAIKNVLAKSADDIVIIACHLNGQGAPDPLNVPEANGLASAWQVTGVPTCAVGGAGMQATRVSGSTMQSGIEGRLASIIGNQATTGTSIDASVSNGQLMVKTNTKFFSQTSEPHFISVYVLEDNISGRQYISGQGWDNNAVHNNVLRDAITTNATGDAFVTTAAANEEVAKEFSTAVSTAWNTSNLKVAVVIWKQGSNGRVIVNGSVASVN